GAIRVFDYETAILIQEGNVIIPPGGIQGNVDKANFLLGSLAEYTEEEIKALYEKRPNILNIASQYNSITDLLRILTSINNLNPGGGGFIPENFFSSNISDKSFINTYPPEVID